jgi:outer membrane protein assembly factor BamD (BamD/ComL family)
MRISRSAEPDDPTDVLEAIRALRSGHDAPRAATLLSRYLRDHPRGLVAEDALALSIEAADAMHDVRGASEFAARYLRLYPSGRFHVLASEAAQRTSSSTGDPRH